MQELVVKMFCKKVIFVHPKYSMYVQDIYVKHIQRLFLFLDEIRNQKTPDGKSRSLFGFLQRFELSTAFASNNDSLRHKYIARTLGG